jgi:hypothetical protein
MPQCNLKSRKKQQQKNQDHKEEVMEDKWPKDIKY